MARIRSIKPEHWNDKELANLPLPAHLLWIGMWNFSDDAGIIEADPLLIRSQVFPRRTDIRTEQMEQWLGQLVKARFVIPFEYNGSGYYIHRTFSTHQKIEKPKVSKIPNEVILNVLDHSFENPRRIPDESPTNPRRVGLGEERRGLGEEGRGEETRSPQIELKWEGIIWDIEKFLLEHEKDLDDLCMAAYKTREEVLPILAKYHLWNQSNEKYPKKPLPLIAGLKSWILNEKNFKNGTVAGKNIRTVQGIKPNPQVVPKGGFGQL